MKKRKKVEKGQSTEIQGALVLIRKIVLEKIKITIMQTLEIKIMKILNLFILVNND